MTYKIRGEAEVEKGFGLPRYTTQARLGYTPSDVGYKVWDTDLGVEFTWGGSDWIGGVEVFKQIPFSFQSLLPDTTTVARVAVTRAFSIAAQSASTTGDSRGFAITAPVGGVAAFNIKKNGVTIGTASIADGLNVMSFTIPSATLFQPGDTLEVQTGIQSGAEDVYLTLKVADPDAGYAIGVEPSTLFVAKSGDTMTGPLILDADPSDLLGATTKQYVDNAVPDLSDYATLSADQSFTGLISFTGAVPRISSSPTVGIEIANKQYVDSEISNATVDTSGLVQKTGDTMTGNLNLTAAKVAFDTDGNGNFDVLTINDGATELLAMSIGSGGTPPVIVDVENGFNLLTGSSLNVTSGSTVNITSNPSGMPFGRTNISLNGSNSALSAGTFGQSTLSSLDVGRVQTRLRYYDATGTNTENFNFSQTGLAIEQDTGGGFATYFNITPTELTVNVPADFTDTVNVDATSAVPLTLNRINGGSTALEFQKDGVLRGRIDASSSSVSILHSTATSYVQVAETFVRTQSGSVILDITTSGATLANGTLALPAFTGSETDTTATTKKYVDDQITANAINPADFVDVTSTQTVGGDKTFSDDIIISGDLTVSGTTTTVNSNNVNIGDSIITLNSDETGTPSENGGIEIERGTSTNAQMVFNESTDTWQAGIAGSLEDVSLTSHTHNAQPDYELVAGTGTAAYTLSFTLTAAAAGKANLQVFVNGIKQIGGATKSYTVSGSTVTFTAGNIPTSGDDVEFYGFGNVS